MNTTIFRLLIMITGLLSFCSLYCDAEDIRVYSFMIYEYSKEDYSAPEHEGNRSTGKSGTCTISSEAGIQSSMLSDDEVESYEIWDKSGENLIAKYASLNDFITAIESIDSGCQIRLTSQRYVYIGYTGPN